MCTYLSGHSLIVFILPLLSQDYEAASQMYKLAKEDFKSDKSTTHLTHATLMGAICHLITGMLFHSYCYKYSHLVILFH